MPISFSIRLRTLFVLCRDQSRSGWRWPLGWSNPLCLSVTQRPPVARRRSLHNAAWLEYANVKNVTLGGNANSVDITTRDEARSGFSTEVDVTTSGEMTFEARYNKPTDTGGASRHHFSRPFSKLARQKGNCRGRSR